MCSCFSPFTTRLQEDGDLFPSERFPVANRSFVCALTVTKTSFVFNPLHLNPRFFVQYPSLSTANLASISQSWDSYDSLSHPSIFSTGGRSLKYMCRQTQVRKYVFASTDHKPSVNMVARLSIVARKQRFGVTRQGYHTNCSSRIRSKRYSNQTDSSWGLPKKWGIKATLIEVQRSSA